VKNRVVLNIGNTRSEKELIADVDRAIKEMGDEGVAIDSFNWVEIGFNFGFDSKLGEPSDDIDDEGELAKIVQMAWRYHLTATYPDKKFSVYTENEGNDCHIVGFRELGDNAGG
jgi:hypothetical protein